MTLALRAETFQERLALLQSRLAKDPTNTALLFQLGDLCHDEGAEGDEEATRLAEGYFKRLLELDQRHARARVLYGSVLTMRARDTFWPFTRMSLVRKGIKEMDAAVEMAPQDPAVRFARAVNNFHMPDFLGRKSVVSSDLLILWNQVQADPNSLPTHFKQKIALFHGRMLNKSNAPEQARQVWQTGLEFDPKSPIALDLRKELETAPAKPPPNARRHPAAGAKH